MVRQKIQRVPLSIFFLTLSFICISQKEYKATSDKGVNTVYTIQNGLFEGQYTSFHANGVKKSSGQFMHNLRKGAWTVWDSTGKMVHQRECENPISHKQIFPQPTAKAENVSVTTNDKQSEGFVELPKVNEKNIVFSKMYWRTIMNKEQNPLLFENNRFLKFLTTNILSGKINAYRNSDRKWQKLSIGEYQKRLDSLNSEVVGFQIKETFYFDKQRQIGQIVILGVAPIIRLKDGSTTPQYWVSMPAIRKIP